MAIRRSDMNWLVKLNLYIEKVLAPVVMNVAQIELYHASSFPNNQLFIDDDIYADSSLISSASDDNIMLGIFKNQNKFYLLLLIKSLNTISQTRISVKGSFSFVELAPRVIGFDCKYVNSVYKTEDRY